MKFMLLIHRRDAAFADYKAIIETPGVSPGLQLQDPETATTVRVQDAGTLTTDGPFVAATRIPAARLGGAVEVRPVLEW